MNIEPLEDFVVIKPDSPKTKTPGGILLPSTTQLDPVLTGKVVAAGPTTRLLSEGDIIVYSNFAGAHATLDGDPLLFMKETEVLGKIRA